MQCSNKRVLPPASAISATGMNESFQTIEKWFDLLNLFYRIWSPTGLCGWEDFVEHLIGSAVVAEYMKNRVQKTIIGRHQSLIRRMKYVLQYRNNWRITILMSMNWRNSLFIIWEQCPPLIYDRNTVCYSITTKFRSNKKYIKIDYQCRCVSSGRERPIVICDHSLGAVPAKTECSSQILAFLEIETHTIYSFS